MEPIVTTLPEDFTGTFYFTNPSAEDFIGKWGGRAYTYPAKKTTPMVIMDATPLEVQNIRKKFAKELATREFFRGDKAKQLTSIERANNAPALNSIHQANVYNDNDLKSYIQSCLDPLPMARQSVMDVPKIKVEDQLSRDEDGQPNTQVVGVRGNLQYKDNVSSKLNA